MRSYVENNQTLPLSAQDVSDNKLNVTIFQDQLDNKLNATISQLKCSDDSCSFVNDTRPNQQNLNEIEKPCLSCKQNNDISCTCRQENEACYSCNVNNCKYCFSKQESTITDNVSLPLKNDSNPVPWQSLTIKVPLNKAISDPNDMFDKSCSQVHLEHNKINENSCTPNFSANCNAPCAYVTECNKAKENNNMLCNIITECNGTKDNHKLCIADTDQSPIFQEQSENLLTKLPLPSSDYIHSENQLIMPVRTLDHISCSMLDDHQYKLDNEMMLTRIVTNIEVLSCTVINCTSSVSNVSNESKSTVAILSTDFPPLGSSDSSYISTDLPPLDSSDSRYISTDFPPPGSKMSNDQIELNANSSEIYAESSLDGKQIIGYQELLIDKFNSNHYNSLVGLTEYTRLPCETDKTNENKFSVNDIVEETFYKQSKSSELSISCINNESKTICERSLGDNVPKKNFGYSEENSTKSVMKDCIDNKTNKLSQIIENELESKLVNKLSERNKVTSTNIVEHVICERDENNFFTQNSLKYVSEDLQLTSHSSATQCTNQANDKTNTGFSSTNSADNDMVNQSLTYNNDTVSQSLTDNNDTVNQSLTDHNEAVKQPLTHNNKTVNQSFTDNNEMINQPLSDNNNIVNQSLTDNNDMVNKSLTTESDTVNQSATGLSNELNKSALGHSVPLDVVNKLGHSITSDAMNKPAVDHPVASNVIKKQSIFNHPNVSDDLRKSSISDQPVTAGLMSESVSVHSGVLDVMKKPPSSNRCDISDVVRQPTVDCHPAISDSLIVLALSGQSSAENATCRSTTTTVSKFSHHRSVSDYAINEKSSQFKLPPRSGESVYNIGFHQQQRSNVGKERGMFMGNFVHLFL